MPVSIGRSPFVTAKKGKSKLRTPQARVLQALMPEDLTAPLFDWPLRMPKGIAKMIGVSQQSDCIRRALRGLPKRSSSGKAHDGLLALGYVEPLELDIDGVKEIHYRITAEGIKVIQDYLSNYKLPKIKSTDLCVNKRYKKANDAGLSQ
jgi:hypothetical protein